MWKKIKAWFGFSEPANLKNAKPYIYETTQQAHRTHRPMPVRKSPPPAPPRARGAASRPSRTRSSSAYDSGSSGFTVFDYGSYDSSSSYGGSDSGSSGGSCD